MPETVLVTATCEEGHTWDVWGEMDEEGVKVSNSDMRCPECEESAVKLDLKDTE